MPLEFKKQHDILGKLVRTFAYKKLVNLIGEVAMKTSDSIDLTSFDEKLEEEKMKEIVRTTADFCVPTERPLIDEEIDNAYELSEILQVSWREA